MCVFNQPLNNWNVRNVQYIKGIFEGATSFNQPLDRWQLENVRRTSIEEIFRGATSFNQDLSAWDRFNISRTGEIDEVDTDEEETDDFDTDDFDADEEEMQVAIEVHKAFEKINIQKLAEYLRSKNPPIIPMNNPSNKQFWNDLKRVLENMLIDIFPQSNSEQRQLQLRLSAILDKIKNISFLYREGQEIPRWELIQLILSFVSVQNPKFKKDYFVSFIQDSYEAYTAAQNDDTISCPKGILERFVLSLHTASILSCPENFSKCPEPFNKLIRILCSAVNVQIDWGDLQKNWYKSFNIRDVPQEDRKQHYIDYMTRIVSDICLDDAIENKIKEDADILEKGELMTDENVIMFQDGGRVMLATKYWN